MPSPPPSRPASCPPSRTVFYIFVREKGSQPFEASPSLEHVLHSFSSSSELRFVSYVSIHPSLPPPPLLFGRVVFPGFF